MQNSKHSKSTQCMHAGVIEDTTTQGINSPVFPSSAYKYRETSEVIYPRYFNTANQQAIVKKLSTLEASEDGLIFSSGMAAISTALFGILKSGDHAIFQSELYGGTHNFINSEFHKFGIESTLVNGQDIQSFEAAIKPNTKVIYLETPSNPLLSITDIQAVAHLAKERNITTLIDNTFASPINQNPIELGIDIVLHSGTKYLGGHSDLCFGALLTSKKLKEKITKSALSFGGSLNAMDCYLIERSLKTLGVRVKQQNKNAMKLATFLHDHSDIAAVYYPGLEHHKDHEIAKRQMTGGFGGMLSFEIKDASMDQVNLFLDSLHLIQAAVSLGGVETTICSPKETSHAKLSAEERKKIGIRDGLLRLSVGIEDVDDLIQDIEQALQKVKAEEVPLT
ncbi:PLP-dependent aspartate aminotransferase family protein [Fulvivirgaceae bacterium BMA10]|uniref:PLP-dependent aspartate aminotransferase family protein n=1 Tax=Splendidivirga corallicola TaxID=3051826 RepID=A0ABT8KGQ4_9BACT|nr:PLP-dependent aspartate aminotransferase family protein [Fulvivirgaceae bacterium BMA10]